MPEVIKNNKQLEDCTYTNTEKFNFKNKLFKAKCVKVYDGDTITVVFMIFGEFYKFSVRMDGYDSPEMKPKTKDPKLKSEEKKNGQSLLETFLLNVYLTKLYYYTVKITTSTGEFLQM